MPANEALHDLLCKRISAACPDPPSLPCVPLARVTVNTDGTIGQPQPCAGRQLVYGNALWYDLILCLSERVAQMAGAHILRYVKGDGQKGQAGTTLTDPLIVEVVDGGGNPVPGVMVQFTVTAGGGRIHRTTGKTDHQGQLQRQWMLGPGTGEQQVTATATGSAFSVTFRATAQP